MRGIGQRGICGGGVGPAGALIFLVCSGILCFAGGGCQPYRGGFLGLPQRAHLAAPLLHLVEHVQQFAQVARAFLGGACGFLLTSQSDALIVELAGQIVALAHQLITARGRRRLTPHHTNQQLGTLGAPYRT